MPYFLRYTFTLPHFKMNRINENILKGAKIIELY